MEIPASSAGTDKHNDGGTTTMIKANDAIPIACFRAVENEVLLC